MARVNIGELPSGVNPNLLDNWYFPAPINQRGEVEYSEPGYTIDRWRQNSKSTTTLLDDGIKVSPSATGTELGFFLQHLEPTLVEAIKGRMVTVSILVEDVSGTWKVCPRCGDGDANKFTWGPELITIDKPGFYTATAFVPTGSVDGRETKTMYLLFVRKGDSSPDDYIVVQAIKLELGERQTLAEEVDGQWQLLEPPPSPADELARCMRYQQVLNVAAFYPILKITDTAIRQYVPLQTKLRAKPTIVDKSNKAFGFYGVNGKAVSGTYQALTVQNFSNQEVGINIAMQDPLEEPANNTPAIGFLAGPIILDSNI